MEELGLSEYKATEAYRIVSDSFKLSKIDKFTKKDFRTALIQLGCNADHVDDWMRVRTTKKGSFTKTALNRLVKECDINSFPIRDAVRICAENDWRGFKYEWIKNLPNETDSKKGDLRSLASEILRNAGV